MEQLSSLLNNLKVIGGVGIGIGLYLLLCFLISSYIMHTKTFLKTCGIYGSLVVAGIGGGCICIIIIVLFCVIGVMGACIYFYLNVEWLKPTLKLQIGGVLLGIFAILVGIYGLLSYCMYRRLPLFLKV
jgi:hypothetical protein